MTVHTILLIQTTTDARTRSWSEYPTISAAIQSIIDSFQEQLKARNPHAPNITYDIQDLYNFVDQTHELAGMVYDANIKAYIPEDKKWIKDQIKLHLLKLAKQNQSPSSGGRRRH